MIPDIVVRPATADDMVAVTGIYAPHVHEGTASFEIEPPDAATMAARFDAVAAAGLPWLVADSASGVVGYAYAGAYRPRPAYRFTLEDSIYVSRDVVGQGIGSLLMAALLDAAATCGARQLLAVIGDPPNQHASIALHRRFGFVEAGRLTAVGWKHGAWRDTLLMQRALGPGKDRQPDTV